MGYIHYTWTYITHIYQNSYSIKPPIYIYYNKMPSIAYQKNKISALKWHDANLDKVRAWARKYKQNKDAYKRELKIFYNILL